jgi:hypothetical protein
MPDVDERRQDAKRIESFPADISILFVLRLPLISLSIAVNHDAGDRNGLKFSSDIERLAHPDLLR